MHLLNRNSSGGLALTKFTPGNTPPYAILSHTWGADNEEVVYDNIIKGDGQQKAGWKKLEFCLKRIENDNLKYFWVDTCCINKANNTELSEAINSMFRWYRNAEKCYVYLADLAIKKYEEIGRKRSFRTSDRDLPLEKPWILDFRQSRWFTRGWTLQELLAPRFVEFYSSDGYRLGDRNSLSSVIHAITAIPFAALQGGSLSGYSVDERISWGSSRHTKLEEDAAYSLLGIVGVFMPLIYGEGKISAFSRLRRRIHEELHPPSSSHLPKKIESNEKEGQESVRAWRLTDPREDRERILSSKNPLLKGSCDWILEDPAFERWWNDDENHSLWIHGDPGKGKTMMMMALTDEISRRLKKEPELGIAAFFFCQNTDQKLNNATAIIRGLLFHLAAENPALSCHLRKKYEQGGDKIFEGHNALFTQWSTILDIAQDPEVSKLYLLVDALDECSEESLRQFLTLLTPDRTRFSSKIKWIFTSRNQSYVDEKLAYGRTRCHTSLELNAVHITNAVISFIAFKVNQLAQEKHYSGVLKREVQKYLQQHADNTFLWVSLVCKELEKVPARKVIKIMKRFPSGLEPLYQRMLQGVASENDKEDAVQCQEILQAVVLGQKPLHRDEIGYIAGLPEDIAKDSQTMEDLIKSCGSFLTMRDQKIYLIHQSAKDFFTTGTGSLIFPISQIEAQRRLTERCFVIMSRSLKKDLCFLGQPGVLVSEIDSATVDEAFPQHAQYACCYWGYHAQEGVVLERGDLLVWEFLQERLLLWLEALSLIKQTAVSIQVVDKLLESIKNQSHNLEATLQDVKRFLLFCRSIIEQAPLQVYSSALAFAPVKSFVRKQYQGDLVPWISQLPKTHDSWGALLQTFEGNYVSTDLVAFSPNCKQLVSVDANSWSTLRLWDATTGTLQDTFEGCPSQSVVQKVAFSPDGEQLISVSRTSINVWDMTNGTSLNTVKDQMPVNIGTGEALSPDRKRLASVFNDIVYVWDIATRVSLRTLKRSASSASAIAFSPVGNQLAVMSEDNICLWNTATGVLQNVLEFNVDNVLTMAFSPDGKQLASGCVYSMYIWDTATGDILTSMGDHLSSVESIAFSPNGEQLASGSDAVRLYSATTGVLQKSLEEDRKASLVVFSPNSRKLASVSTNTISIWDAATGALQNRLRGHSEKIVTLAFLPDSVQLVSGSKDNTVRLWDTVTEASPDMSEDHSDTISTVAFSPNNKYLVSGSRDHTLKLWDSATGALRYTVKSRSGSVFTVTFSPSGDQFVSGQDDNTVRFWNTVTGNLQYILRGHIDDITLVLFSPDGKQLASVSNDYTIRLWNTATGLLLNKLEHLETIRAVAFSPDGQQLGSGPCNKAIQLWDTSTGALRCILEGHSEDIVTLAFSPDGRQLASSSFDRPIHLWDTSTGALRRTIKGQSEYVNTPVSSRDSKRSIWSAFDPLAKYPTPETFERNFEILSENLRKAEVIEKYPNRRGAVAFSPDGKQIASGPKSSDKAICLYDVAAGALQQCWNLGCPVEKLEFSADGATLEMDRGFIKLNPTSSYEQDCTTMSSSCIIDNDNWVRLQGMRAVLIPPEMRPILSACKAGKIAIATIEGRILFMSFDPMLFPLRSV